MTKKKLPKGYSMRADGRIVYRFSENGKRFSIYGNSVKEIEQNLLEKKNEVRKQSYIENRKITVNQYFKEFLRNKAGSVKQSTIYDNQKKFSRVADLIGNRKVIDIERREILAVQKELAKKYTTAGVNAIITLLYSVFESAKIDRIIEYNPCADVKQLKRTEPKARDTIHRALTIEEQKAFFEAAKGTFYYNFFAFLVSTGMRSGEAAALTWHDINFDEKIISINKTLSRSDNETFIISDTPKTESSNRSIFLTEEVEKILNDQKQQNFDLGLLDFGGRIFTDTRGGFVKASNTTPCINKILKNIESTSQIKIDHFSCHAFRDTYATRFVENSNNYKVLQSILGHANISITMNLYAHALPETISKEMQNVKIVI